ncbi:hypothetical protein QZH41_013929, partial [Actinostola sp. cb2023]
MTIQRSYKVSLGTKQEQTDLLKCVLNSFYADVTVKCTRDYMEAMIDRKVMSNLDTTNLHLEDANCKSTEITADFIKFRTSLDGCGTTHNVSDDGKYLVYHNAITGDLVAPTTETLITREHTAVMPFQCSYEKVVVLSVHAYTPRRAVIYTRTESFGNFSFTMDMYKTEKYEEAHGDDDYPVNVATGQRLYLEVTVVSNDSSLAVVPVVCKATPTEGYDDKPQYVFINERIDRRLYQDKTMKYDFEKSAVQRFSIAAFRFLPSYDNVYFHCKVTACPQGDSNSRCAVGCKSGDKSRRRREVPEREIEYDITLGPVSLKSDKQSM